jgi:hypothetical protein
VGGSKQIGWIGEEEGFGFEASNRIIASDRRETKTGKKKKTIDEGDATAPVHTYIPAVIRRNRSGRGLGGISAPAGDEGARLLR